MTTFYTNDPTRFGGCYATHDPTATQGAGAPVITLQPQDTTITLGNPATLTVTATGTGLTYQWYQGLSGDTANPLAGETAATLIVSPSVDTDYWVRVTNGFGSVDSTDATVTVNPAEAGGPGFMDYGGSRRTRRAPEPRKLERIDDEEAIVILLLLGATE